MTKRPAPMMTEPVTTFVDLVDAAAHGSPDDLYALLVANADPNAQSAGITPLGRAASIDDVSNAALFLLSERAAHITGQTLVIDGGWTVTSPQP